jgi:DNA-directed RNA polymerase specialized sigma24 family protein
VLIAAIAAGDSNALEQLYNRYGSVVYRVTLRMLKNRELAEDVVQEVFWRVWRRSARQSRWPTSAACRTRRSPPSSTGRSVRSRRVSG